jgi:hypothetical protein
MSREQLDEIAYPAALHNLDHAAASVELDGNGCSSPTRNCSSNGKALCASCTPTQHTQTADTYLHAAASVTVSYPFCSLHVSHMHYCPCRLQCRWRWWLPRWLASTSPASGQASHILLPCNKPCPESPICCVCTAAVADCSAGGAGGSRPARSQFSCN